MKSIKLKESIKIYKLLKRIIEVIKKKYYTLLIKKWNLFFMNYCYLFY